MIITIGREFGSGGREIGRRLAERLKIAYYDQEIVTELVERTEHTEKYIRNVEEQKPLPLMPITVGRTFCRYEDQLIAQDQSVYVEQSRVIREAAERSDCVIVGRCADYVLKDRKPFRIFIYAQMSSKIQRCRERGQFQTGLSDREMTRKIKAVDRARAGYYNFYTEQKWGEKESYDLCINTTAADLKALSKNLAGWLSAADGTDSDFLK